MSDATALRLRRRDWLLDVQQRQRALSPRVGGLLSTGPMDADEFLDFFYAPGQPVLIDGALAGWPALDWTPGRLKALVGRAEVEVQGGRGDDPDFELNKDAHARTLPFAEFIDRVVASGGNDLYLTAFNSRRNADALAPLRAELGRPGPFLTDGPGMIWIGPEGTFTPLHHDLTNNLLVQVVGAKRVLLLPPSETARLYNHTHVFSAVRDLTDPERLRGHPLAAAARRYELTLGPGQMLFVPVGWWHQVTSLSFSVSLTHTNFLWPNDAAESFPSG